MTRLKYKNINGAMQTDCMLTEFGVLYVKIQGSKAEFITFETENIIETIEDINSVILKKKIKKRLREIGVNFSDEIRKKKENVSDTNKDILNKE